MESKVRSEQSTEQLFEALWEEKDRLGSEPHRLEGVESSYGLPVLIAIRSVVTPYPENFQSERGFVVGLFEDRRGLASEMTLSDFPNAQWDILLFTDQEVDDTAYPIAAVEPLGWLVLETRPYAPHAYVAHTSHIINTGNHIYVSNLRDDPYFLSFAKVHSPDAITVGFHQTRFSRRLNALRKLPEKDQAQFLPSSDPSEWTEEDKTRYELLRSSRLHTRKGLGSLLIDMGRLITRRMGCSAIHFETCGWEAELLLGTYSRQKIVDLHSSNGSIIMKA